MEVGDQGIYPGKFVSGSNEKACVALDGSWLIALRGRRFQSPNAGRADGHDASACCFRGLYLRDGLRGDAVAFRMHHMLAQLLSAHGLEGSGAPMQRDESLVDALRSEEHTSELQSLKRISY